MSAGSTPNANDNAAIDAFSQKAAKIDSGSAHCEIVINRHQQLQPFLCVDYYLRQGKNELHLLLGRENLSKYKIFNAANFLHALQNGKEMVFCTIREENKDLMSFRYMPNDVISFSPGDYYPAIMKFDCDIYRQAFITMITDLIEKFKLYGKK